MIPAAGQGALALQVRAGTTARRRRRSTAIERRRVGAARADRRARRRGAAASASCASPIGVHARVDGERLEIEAFVGLPDGSEWLRDRIEADADEPAAGRRQLAERLLGAGARELLDRAEAADPRPVVPSCACR